MKFVIAIGILLLSFQFDAFAQIPRSEYPCPQFERKDWVNLNGQWIYTFDFGNSGHNRRFYECEGFNSTIIVPFCPESKLSGVGHKDFINNMWYQRKVSVPEAWSGKRIILHFWGYCYTRLSDVEQEQNGIY